MNLPFFKKFNKKVVPLYFLVLVLRDEKAQAVIFEELEGLVKIVGQKEEHFSTSIDEIPQEELLEKLDKAISSAESSLPENIQTQKTVFGVKESWTDNDQIRKGYLVKLKRASEELGLVPIGFLVISQAIAHLLQKEEGAPVSAILAEINKKSVTVTLLRAGKSIETKSSEIHESIPFTVDTLLKHFNVPEILPSRIIIFNDKEDLSQEFISHTWSKSLPFLHLPQITNLPAGFDAKAVLFGAATQLGFEVLNRDMPKEPPVEDLFSKEKTQTIEKKTLEEKPMVYKNLGAADFGFTKDVDVAKMPAEEEQPARQMLSHQATAGGGIIPQIDTEEKNAILNPRKRFEDAIVLTKNILIFILGLILTVVRKINKGKLSIIIPAILILIVALITSYFLFLKATIMITVDPKITEQNKSVLFSTTQSTNSNNNIIKGEFVTVSEDGSVSTVATGKKDVGTNAKGAITILSSLSSETTIKEGSIVTSSNGLQFIIDNNIKIASSSGLDDLKSSKTNVTAKDLGKEYNLPSGTKFTIGSFDSSQVVAKNDNPFSGGTKKEVTVISKNDSAKLEENLVKQLENNAMRDLKKQIGESKILLSTLTSKTISKKSLSAKIGDEVNQLTLMGSVEYQGISYDKNDLIAFSKSLLSKGVPSNQEIDYNNIKTSVLDMKNKNDDEIEANLNVKALLLPKIDADKLTKDLKKKSFKAAENALYKIPQVVNVDIKLFPNLPFLPKNLPSREKNIKFVIKFDG